MSALWIVNVGGRDYGPYSHAQMADFVAEGRLAPQSLIAHAGDTNYRAASAEPELASLFAAEKTEPTPAADGARSENRPQATFGKSRDTGQKSGELSHILVITDIKSRTVDALEEEITKLGPACAIAQQVWLLKTEQSVNVVRNVLVQHLGKIDFLFVVDATNDKAAWFNFPPQAEARIRRVWSRDGSESPTRAAS